MIGLSGDIIDWWQASLRDLDRRAGESTRRLQAGIADTAERNREWTRLRLLGEAREQRQRLMAADPLGTLAQVHRGKDGFGELAPIDLSNAAALPQQLAARMRQANMLARFEGMRSVPILTAPEREQMATLITSGTRDQQVALLSGMAGGLGAEGTRRTLDTLMAGRREDADPRLLTFTAAAAVAARVLDAGEDVPAAMYREDVGEITFDAGTPGDPARDFQGGSGLLHIAAKRSAVDGIDGQAWVRERLPEVLAHGRLERLRGPPNGRRADIVLGDDQVMLSLMRHGQRVVRCRWVWRRATRPAWWDAPNAGAAMFVFSPWPSRHTLAQKLRSSEKTRRRMPAPPLAARSSEPMPLRIAYARCQWPLWPDGAPPPRPALFCGAPAVAERAYCAACLPRAYEPPQPSG